MKIIKRLARQKNAARSWRRCRCCNVVYHHDYIWATGDQKSYRFLGSNTPHRGADGRPWANYDFLFRETVTAQVD